MRIDVISAVVKIFDGPLSESILKRAQDKKIAEIVLHNLRDYADGSYRQVDDKPFGGGAGMLLKPEPLFRCLNKLLAEREYDEVIYLSPQGVKFNQKRANALSLSRNLILICGHYKGIDQRVIDKFVTKEISIGDYVITGGEAAAIVVIDAIVRLLPGVLNDSESALTDSFQTESGFDAPAYTRPAEYEGMKVPEVLLNGNHKDIAAWRMEQGKKKYRRVKRVKKEK
ncbi:MAG TPA: tRNA (guanosine(37)-N1)-methyltransferase TrmD [Ignavibacteria bacterium]|nr:tRNA (guanosine(37)-N1)-methyltransferase TrmD [Ignavibacteria bacterium]HMR00088.1 tRNA (guanosine(37)-N1)-methyltransferase TrmD [Ignavibacteria bacterium]